MTGVTRMTRGLDHSFPQKFQNFPSFQVLAKSASKMSLKVFLKGKKAFLDFKKQKVQKVEESGFFQRSLIVHGFGTKI